MTWIDGILLGALIIHSIRLFFLERKLRNITDGFNKLLTELPTAVIKTVDITVSEKLKKL